MIRAAVRRVGWAGGEIVAREEGWYGRNAKGEEPMSEATKDGRKRDEGRATWPSGRAFCGPARGTQKKPGTGPARPVACRAREREGPCLGRGLRPACQPGTAREAFFNFFAFFSCVFLFFY